MKIKSSDGLIQSGWVASLAALAGAFIHKGVSLVNETFGYEAFVPIFTTIVVGIYTEFRGKKKKE